MHALLLTIVLSQTPDPQCVSVNGQRVCGFDCKIAQGTARCAQTPAGVCSEASGQIVCFDPPIWLLRVYGKSVPKPTCIWRGVRSACGYNCDTMGDSMACARTPRGVCKSAYDRVTCSDPPSAAYFVFGKEVPQPTCDAFGGKVFCGYSCRSTLDRAACARTPFGVCDEREGTLSCFDPPPQVICKYLKRTPKPTCLASFGVLACGYNCKAVGGSTACAKSPEGSCDTEGGGPVCFDPPLDDVNGDCLALQSQ